MKFADFQKKLKGVRFRVVDAWSFGLPFGTDREKIQIIIDICRDNLIVDWHIVYVQPTEAVPEPEISIYWDRNDE